MTVPRWNDPELRAGTMVRSALWLITEVGEGNCFTKEQHRRAFPGIAQADRRMRDLRSYGWVIHTSAEDASLDQEEQRFVAAGLPVWDSKARSRHPRIAISAKMRMAALAESNYQCVVCGIAGGENYVDAPSSTAVLGVSRRDAILADGRSMTILVAECKLCRARGRTGVVDLKRFLESERNLSSQDRAVLRRWIHRGRSSQLDKLWSEYRSLSAPAQIEIRKGLPINE